MAGSVLVLTRGRDVGGCKVERGERVEGERAAAGAVGENAGSEQLVDARTQDRVACGEHLRSSRIPQMIGRCHLPFKRIV